MGSTVRIEVEPASSEGTTTQVLISLLNELRHAQTIADVAIAAGIARQELLDLVVDHDSGAHECELPS